VAVIRALFHDLWPQELALLAKKDVSGVTDDDVVSEFYFPPIHEHWLSTQKPTRCEVSTTAWLVRTDSCECKHDAPQTVQLYDT